ncbi:MAG: SCO6880 family protein [Acidimicrobiia bacterium]
MTPAQTEARAYRLSQLVRTGLFGSMPASQVIVLGVGCGLSFVGVLLRLFPWALVPALVAAVVAFKRVGIWSLHELIPLRFGWWARRREHRWFRAVPLLAPGEDARDDLPPPMHGLRLLDVDASWAVAPRRLAGVGVVWDSEASVLTAVLRATGDGQFSLLSADTQDARVALWGDALGAFCRERAAVCRIAWQEWSTATRLDAPVVDTQRAGALAVAAADYADLVTRSAPRAVTHDTLVSISLDLAKVPSRRSRGTNALSAGLQMLVEELRLFTVRLEAAGLIVDPPLSPAELTSAVRLRSSPFAEPQHRALSSSLAVRLGVGVSDLASMAVDEQWEQVRVDNALHRSWWIEGWPRSEVPAVWMDLLLLGGECTRTVSVVFEPVAPSQSAREVDEASVSLESAEAAKSKRGFRVRAGDRRAREDVERREHELVAGFGELTYCGLVTVSARTLDELEDASADFEQSAAHAGVQLRPLVGRHGKGWVSALPLGRTVAERRRW